MNEEHLVPPGFEGDMDKALQIERQKQQNTQMAASLIVVYTRMLERLSSKEFPTFYALIQLKLGVAYLNLPTEDRASNLKRAIAHFQEALRIWTPEIAPFDYATTQNNLGNAYSDLPTGSRSANVKRAIGYYQEALRFWTAENSPFDYAMVQNNLGLAYNDLPTGSCSANIKRAIGCYQEALRIWTAEDSPLDYAMVQNNLGNAYSDLPTGNPTANLQRAIVCYEEALCFWTPETAPLYYALTQNNLGLAYNDLPTGDRTAHLQRAIGCYREALRIWTPEAAPFDYAVTQHNLGLAYSNLLTGDHIANLEQAIVCYEEALRFRTPETAPLDYAMTQNNLGNIYSDLPTGDQTAHLQRAIACYEEALRFRTAEAAPLDYATTQNNLGSAYQELLIGDRTAHLQRAIACYEEALRFRTIEAAPLDYATTQNNLGNAYLYIPTEDRTVHLQRAIVCYEEALHIWTPEIAPLDYATTQNNLGEAYRELPTGDRAANLERAIICYKEALRFWTPETAPLDYARTQNNLGIAYSDLPIGNQAAHLAQTIICYEEALRFWTPEAAPLHYARAQNNLGNTYYKLSTGDRTANFKQASIHYEEALRFWTPETAPLDYAMTQNNLGSIYSDLPTGDRAANLKQASIHYKEALRFWTPETAPLDYAMALSDLGFAYQELPTGDQSANFKHAIICYEKALHFLTLETAPFPCRYTNLNLALLYFKQEQWEAAFEASKAAMQAGERLYQVGISSGSKAAEMRENAPLYQVATFSALRSKKGAEEALLLLEQGKTRLLTEALRLRIARPDHIADTTWSLFMDASARLRMLQTKELASLDNRDRSLEAYKKYEQTMQEANAALDFAITQVQADAPDFLKPLNGEQIRNLIPDDYTVFIAFCLTEQGSVGFTVSNQGIEMTDIAFTQADLDHLFAPRNGGNEEGESWLGSYQRFSRERSPENLAIWQGTMVHTLEVLGQNLLAPLLSKLPEHITHIVFLPATQLFLFPLHAVPLSAESSERVCDRYQISYAPSLEVLAVSKTRTARPVIPHLYAVINPQMDPLLMFTTIEGQVVARSFHQCEIDEGSTGTKERVLAALDGKSYIHFACHGNYNWNIPTASGIDLADDTLTLAELQQEIVDLSHVRLVVLSACETGMIDVIQSSPQEYVGVPAGFLLAGVPCVISSLWKVPDLSTALLMERFYQNHLKEKRELAAALQEAQRWIRELAVGEIVEYIERWRQQTPLKIKNELFKLQRYYHYQNKQNPAWCPFAHPYYWAAFTMSGV